MEAILAVFSDFKSRCAPVSMKESEESSILYERIVDALVAKKGDIASELLRENLAAAENILWHPFMPRPDVLKGAA